MSDIKNQIKSTKTQTTINTINNIVKELYHEGLYVVFGKIGTRTTYALIHDEDHKIEYVGYTYVKNMKYYDDNTGKLRALQQAIARKDIAEESN